MLQHREEIGAEADSHKDIGEVKRIGGVVYVERSVLEAISVKGEKVDQSVPAVEVAVDILVFSGGDLSSETHEGKNLKRKSFATLEEWQNEWEKHPAWHGKSTAAMQQELGTLSGTLDRKTYVSPNITVKDKGLVMLREVEVTSPEGESTIVVGPGRVSKAIGLNDGETRTLNIADPINKVLRME